MIEVRERLAAVEVKVSGLQEDFRELKDLIEREGAKTRDVLDRQEVKVDKLHNFISHWKAVGLVFMTIGAFITYLLDNYHDLIQWMRKTL